MTPYYEADGITLYLGDCREQTAWLAADVLVTDPPYGRAWRQGHLPGHNSQNASSIANDHDTSTRDTALTAWGARPAVVFGDLMLPPPTGTKLVAIYRKPPNAGIRGAIGGFRRDAEAVYLVGQGFGSGIGGRSSVLTTAVPLMGGPTGRSRASEWVGERYCEVIASRLAQGDLFGGAA